MEYVPVNIANGVLTTSAATLYNVPVGSTVMIRSIVMVNKTATAVTVTMTVKFGPSGVARNVIPPGMTLGPLTKMDDNSVIPMPEGSAIAGSASVANSVDYFINGVQSS